MNDKFVGISYSGCVSRILSGSMSEEKVVKIYCSASKEVLQFLGTSEELYLSLLEEFQERYVDLVRHLHRNKIFSFREDRPFWQEQIQIAKTNDRIETFDRCWIDPKDVNKIVWIPKQLW